MQCTENRNLHSSDLPQPQQKYAGSGGNYNIVIAILFRGDSLSRSHKFPHSVGQVFARIVQNSVMSQAYVRHIQGIS